MKRLMILGLVLLIAAIAAPSFATIVADSQADFSDTAQGNNGWYYKVYVLGSGDMTEMDLVNNWAIVGNPFWVSVGQAPWSNSSCGVGKTLMRGYYENVWAPAREWVAPSAVGPVKISGTFAKALAGTKNQQFFIKINGVSVYTLDVLAADVSTHTYEVVATLGVGDKVDFIFNPNTAANWTTPAMGPEDLDANMTATIETMSGASLTANVSLGNYSGDLSLLPIRVTLQREGGAPIVKTVTPSANTTAVVFTDLPAGNYIIRAEAAKCLARAMTYIVEAGSNSTVEISIPNGDLNGDGTIGGSDLFVLRTNWGKTEE